jgi:hypothetical protein
VKENNPSSLLVSPLDAHELSQKPFSLSLALWMKVEFIGLLRSELNDFTLEFALQLIIIIPKASMNRENYAQGINS